MTETAHGWVIHPSDYDVAAITSDDLAHDSSLRLVMDADAQAIISGEITAL